MSRLDLVGGAIAIGGGLLCWAAIFALLGWPLAITAIVAALWLIAVLWGAAKGRA